MTHDERWREWQAAYRKSSAEGTRWAIVVVTVIFAGIASVLAYQVTGPWT